MSTLKVDNLLNSAGNESPISVPGAAKAWINFNAETSTIRNSFNISSITDNSLGNFTLNFTNAMANGNYAFAGTSGRPEAATSTMNQIELPDNTALSTSMTTTGLTVEIVFVTSTNDRTNVDRQFASVIVFGD